MRLTELFKIESSITMLTESANREVKAFAKTQRFVERQLNEARKATTQSSKSNIVQFPSKKR